MKHKILFALLTVVILALLLATKAFIFVFATILNLGIIALVCAGLIYVAYRIMRKSKDNDNG